jgi:hypothetical protein
MSGTQGSFHISNGLIVAPNGQNFIAKGINIRWDQLDAAVGDGVNMPLLNDFPGLNMIRLNFEDYNAWDNPSQIQAAVNALTARGIVVEIEDHTGISSTPYTGAQLAAEQAWYASVATMFKNNPYVWYGTYNEPGNGSNLAGIAAQEVATYNTIRATGNTNPILMEEPSGGNPGTVGTNATGYDGAGPMTPSAYASMTNIIWDLHYYGWVSNYSTNLAAVQAGLTGSVSGASGIAGAQSIRSADGLVPVIIGEFGNSTTGGAVDANGDQVIQAVAASGKGFLAWGWNPDPTGDQLTTDSGAVTHYGNQIQAIIGSTPATPPGGTPAPTPPPTAAPAPGGNEITTASGGTLTDAAGNKWTLSSAGVVSENGTMIAGSAGTAAFAIVSNVLYGQDAASKAWFIYSPTNQTWTAASAPVLTPAPTSTPGPTASANDTVVKLGSAAAIVDASKNKWTITAGGQIAVNGTVDTTTTNVAELAYVNGTVWQENTSSLWWGKTSPTAAWSPGAGTTLSPLPATPVPTTTPAPTASPNDAIVKLGSTAAITDASLNKWTITAGGQVAVNGVVDTATAHVTELAYVNGTVWQENTSNLWWGKSSPTTAWGPAAGTATNPLPTSITIAATQASATVSLSQISIVATSGNHMVFISGSGDTVNLSGGTDTITDTGSGNTYVIPAAGKGYDTFASNVLSITGDKLDLRTALAATNWNHTASTLANYLSVTNPSQGAVLSIAPTSGGAGVAIATINGATGPTLTGLLAHSLTA